jgi:hypothetical protein
VYKIVDVDVEEYGRNGTALQNAASAEKGWRWFAIHRHPRLNGIESQAADDSIDRSGVTTVEQERGQARVIHHVKVRF